MPRMKTTAPEDSPLIGEVVSKTRFGVKAAISEISSKPRSSMAVAVKAVTATGVSCRLSSRFCAVTMISSMTGRASVTGSLANSCPQPSKAAPRVPKVKGLQFSISTSSLTGIVVPTVLRRLSGR